MQGKEKFIADFSEGEEELEERLILEEKYKRKGKVLPN